MILKQIKLNSNWLFKGVGILFIFLVLVLVVFQPASAAACKFKYKVRSGDTLIIVADLYQTDWKEIADASGLQEPYVLQVGQVLCIPSGVAPAGSTSDSTTTKPPTNKASLSGVANFMHVTVIVENFPKKHVYNVRVANPPRFANATVIGRLKTDKNGDFSGYFRLPDGFQLTTEITLCLKDPWTDKLYCTDYDNPFDIYNHQVQTCYKTGR